jgi:acyl carrier protein
MNNEDAMEDTLIEYIKTEFLRDESATELDAETDLLLSGILDSLGVMRLVGFIEKQFNVAVPPQDVTIENFMTINTLTSYLEKKLAT